MLRKTEKWTIKENEITKELLNLELNGYYYYPEIFPVKQNYCTFVWNWINHWRIDSRKLQEIHVTYISKIWIKKKNKKKSRTVYLHGMMAKQALKFALNLHQYIVIFPFQWYIILRHYTALIATQPSVRFGLCFSIFAPFRSLPL